MSQQVLDVSNEVAAELAGVEDGVLDALRERLGCTIALRGNRLTLGGDDEHVTAARAVVDELVELVLLVLGLLLATALAERLRGLDPSLALPLQHLELFLVGERSPQLLLRGLERVQHQAERVAAIAVPGEPRCLELPVDPLDEAHRPTFGL